MSNEEEVPENPFEDLDQEDGVRLKRIIESFMQDIGEFTMEKDMEDQYGALLMFCFETVVEESVPADRSVVEFADQFKQYCQNLLDEGVISTQDEEDLDERFKAAKEKIKEREGRK